MNPAPSKKNRKILRRGGVNIYNAIIITTGTFFYIGYLPFIPGTFASLVGLGIFYLMKDSLPHLAIFTAAMLILGFLVAGRLEEILKKKDSRCIVIDEISGMLLSLIWLPYDIKVVLAAFFLFRLLDSLKPYPAGLLQNLRGGKGVMLDDIVAGVYTNIILQLALRLASFTAS